MPPSLSLSYWTSSEFLSLPVQRTPAEVIASSDLDEIFCAGLTGEDTQNLLEGLLIPASLETPRDPIGQTGDWQTVPP